MKKFIKIMIIFLIIILITITIILIWKNKQPKSAENINTISQINQNTSKNTIKNNNDTFVFDIEEEETSEEEEEPSSEPTKDASTLTQEIYNINGPIGTLVIPKTGLETQVYSSVTVDELEVMPCFLYTTGGLSKKGTTLIVGHNRRNGKLFSNNKKLEVGDEFYFTDYEGTQLKYTIYSKFVTTEDDISFLNTEVDNPVIALSCCTDASDENRIIILGRAD